MLQSLYSNQFCVSLLTSKNNVFNVEYYSQRVAFEVNQKNQVCVPDADGSLVLLRSALEISRALISIDELIMA